MGQKLVVGPVNKGLVNNREPFYIDNDSFPVLINAYQWRGRIKRKRGTSFLNRLQRYFDSTSTAYGSTSSFNLSGGGGNLLTDFNLPSTGEIIPGTITFTVALTPSEIFTDTAEDGNLLGDNGTTGTIQYSTGAITIDGASTEAVSTASFRYYAGLPVMGLEELQLTSQAFPGNIAFDTKKAYNMLTTTPYNIYNVSWYKNPATGDFSGYTQKTTMTPLVWNGDTYQQFWSTNYQGALWATNGITAPFNGSSLGMQFKALDSPGTSVTVTSPTTASLAITGHGLVKGDFIFINEVASTTGINMQTGYVTGVTDPDNVVVTFPNATLATNGTGGIAQYLTSNADSTKDCMRWYDGDPTDGSVTAPVLTPGNGWVNYCPPLSLNSYIISDLPSDKYYLVSARIIVPFKDFLLFIGPVVQTSSGSPIYLQDTIIYSQNGTPYYTSSFEYSDTTNLPTAADLVISSMNPVLLPDNQTSTPAALLSDVVGYGGFLQLGYDEPIVSAQSNEDVLILGLSSRQGRLAYTGNDIVPFAFYLINSEYGTESTFSAVNFDTGVIAFGPRGITMTSQEQCVRVDMQVPNEIFQIQLTGNGPERVSAKRDFQNEWIYFTYTSNNQSGTFPNQTLMYNYRDESWAIFFESYTTYGIFRASTGRTWATIGDEFPTWGEWNEAWSSGSTTLLQQQIIAGNQQGFVIQRDEGTGESNSLFIQSISGNTITSPSHNLQNNDYIVISGCLGTIGDNINGNVYSVANVTTNTFDIDATPSGSYSGSGVIKKMYVPFIQSKQFPMAWGLGRKTRIGPQQYLLDTTADSQITLLIYLSENTSSPFSYDGAYNIGNIVPGTNVVNSSLVYSNILYTCPESTNIGLTAANVNLQMPTAMQQNQIWHRINTSLIGDTVQVCFTLSDAQMRNADLQYQFSEIGIHGFILDISPSQFLS